MKRVVVTIVVLLNLGLSVAAHALEGYAYLPATSDDIEEALSSNSWRTAPGTATFAFDGQAHWLRYDIPPQDAATFFTIDNPWLIHIDVHLVDGAGEITTYPSGTSRPLSERPIVSSVFAFPINPDVAQIYVYHDGRAATYFPVQLLSAVEFSEFNARLNIFHGLYYGIVLIMVLYNLAMFAGTRVRAYLYYSLYAASLTVFLTTADGTGALFLWPETPALNNVMLAVGWSLALILLLEFAHSFLNLADTNRLVQGRRILQAAIFLSACLTLAAPGPLAYLVQSGISTVTFVALLYIGAYAAQKGHTNGVIFLTANSMIAAGGLAHLGMLFAVFEPSIVLQHSVHLGSMAELAILSAALVRQLKDSEDARFEAHQRLQEVSRRNKELRAAKTLAEEHRQLQKSLQQAQKLKTIGQLAGGFAHDFNNILASILGFAELARDKSSLDDRTKLIRYLEEIQHSGERGANLVKQLLVYSRSSPSEPKELNLGDTLRQAQDLLRGSLPATVGINTHLPEQTIHLHIDPEQLQQVLVNLCINAAEAMHNRGQIDIHLEMTTADQLRCSSCLSRFSGEYIAIKVEDSGSGISGTAENIFTPFQTSKAVGQGIGLGLSVVHGIVHEHGGHVHAANRAEGGARFVVYFPPEAAKLGVQTTGKRILLIEDDPSVAMYLESLLDPDEFETVSAAMPTEALETFVANPESFDLVITDHLMPQGTGLELAEDIHALRPDLPVILTTGNANNLDPEALATASLAGIFEKPLNSEQLLAKIRALLAV